MKQPKNSVALALIFSSLILLLMFQFLWLKKLHRDASDNFRRETHRLFRDVVIGLSDSLLMKSIEPMKSDTSIRFFSNREFDTVHLKKRNHFRIKDTTANVQVFISSSDEGDSLERFLKPLITKIRKDKSQKKFTIRLSPDSLHLGDIKREFKKNLLAANIDLPFIISREKSEIPFPPKPMVLEDDVIFTPTGGYKVEFADVNMFVIKTITPQIFFSLVLTLLTSGSFFLLFRSLKLQQRLMEQKNDFIGNVTHELKTPIATVSVALEALKNFSAKDNPKLTEEYLDMAKGELDRLTTMTNKILDASIFESKGVQFEHEQTNLDNIIQEMMNAMKVLFEKRDAHVTYIREGENFEIQGGTMHLTNVIYNLVDNALKYSSEKPIVKITLKGEKQKLLLSVQDNGIGIASEFQHKIFEKFFRIPSGNVHNSKGYGLGLHYVASVIKSHHGVIDVISKPNEGSTFVITIPRPPGRIFRKNIGFWPTKNQPSSDTLTS